MIAELGSAETKLLATVLVVRRPVPKVTTDAVPRLPKVSVCAAVGLSLQVLASRVVTVWEALSVTLAKGLLTAVTSVPV